MNPKWIFGIGIFSILFSCSSKREEVKNVHYASLDSSTTYVGIQTCGQCHSDKFETFIHTGMGSSIDVASKKKSSADFSKMHVIHDAHKDLSYYPFWNGDSLKVCEFRISKSDTIYKRIETVNWIIGSGQHTNSHLMNVNGYIYQVPMTYYTQKGTWDFPPGFEGNYNSRFSRMIGLECMSCHNAYPKIVEGSENKYSDIPNGIDCERCHGPGSAHVKQKMAGQLVDISKEIDYSIVNPAKLSIDLQIDVCQRCHIQGNTVLNDGKSFLDFRPGMRLSDVMDVYMPLFKGDDENHIMASHAERMKMSKCYIKTYEKATFVNSLNPTITPYKNAMTCVTCHDPHVSVRSTDHSVFISKCKSCHSTETSNPNAIIDTIKECTESMKVRQANGDNCIKCHMPKNNTIDIPHVTSTDHWIRIPKSEKEIKRIKEFAGLVCINNPYAERKSLGEAFLSYYEKFSNNTAYLDSAKKYLDDSDEFKIDVNFKNLIRWAYLKNDYQQVIRYSKAYVWPEKAEVLKSNNNDFAWTAYRIGESFYELGKLRDAIINFKRAVEIAPFSLDFRNKLAGALLDDQKVDEAKNNYEFIIQENPKYASAYVSLGYLYLIKDGNVALADQYYDKALSLDPDNLQAFLNKGGLKMYQGKKQEAKKFFEEVIKRDKNNQQAKMLLKELS